MRLIFQKRGLYKDGSSVSSIAYDWPADIPVPRPGDIVSFDGSDPSASIGDWKVQSLRFRIGDRGCDGVVVNITQNP